MKIRFKFTKYIIKNFIKWGLIVAGALTFIIILFSFIELMRRSQTSPHVKLGHIIKLSLLQAPIVLDQITPLVVLFSTIFFLWNLHKKSEIIVMRSLGYSIWDIMIPLITGITLYSFLYLLFFNGVISSTRHMHEQYSNKVFKRNPDPVSLSKSGLWLKQTTPDNGYFIVHTKQLSSNQHIEDATLYQFSQTGQLLKRYDVESIDIESDQWHFRSPKLTESNDIQATVPDFSISTSLTVEKIKKTFQNIGSISFLELPSFIKLIKKTGFSDTVHQLHFYKLLLRPLLLLSMALLGGVCAFSSIRGNNAGIFLVSGVGAGFLSHFLHQVFFAIGESQKIPVFFAAFTPTCISLLISLTLLMHLEEG